MAARFVIWMPLETIKIERGTLNTLVQRTCQFVYQKLMILYASVCIEKM
jgi:hypothetical protein